jgi:cardiolipin synthase
MNDLRAAPNQLTFLRLCIVPSWSWPSWTGTSGRRPCCFSSRRHRRTRRTAGQAAASAHGAGTISRPGRRQTAAEHVFLVLNHEGFISRRVTVLVFGRDLGILVVSAILYVEHRHARLSPQHLRQGEHSRPDHCSGDGADQPVLCAPGYILAIRAGSLDATMALTVVSGFNYAWRWPEAKPGGKYHRIGPERRGRGTSRSLHSSSRASSLLSISISRNSPDSKTSRHSSHSTYSASSLARDDAYSGVGAGRVHGV